MYPMKPSFSSFFLSALLLCPLLVLLSPSPLCGASSHHSKAADVVAVAESWDGVRVAEAAAAHMDELTTTSSSPSNHQLEKTIDKKEGGGQGEESEVKNETSKIETYALYSGFLFYGIVFVVVVVFFFRKQKHQNGHPSRTPSSARRHLHHTHANNNNSNSNKSGLWSTIVSMLNTYYLQLSGNNSNGSNNNTRQTPLRGGSTSPFRPEQKKNNAAARTEKVWCFPACTRNLSTMNSNKGRVSYYDEDDDGTGSNSKKQKNTGLVQKLKNTFFSKKDSNSSTNNNNNNIERGNGVGGGSSETNNSHHSSTHHHGHSHHTSGWRQTFRSARSHLFTATRHGPAGTATEGEEEREEETPSQSQQGEDVTGAVKRARKHHTNWGAATPVVSTVHGLDRDDDTMEVNQNITNNNSESNMNKVKTTSTSNVVSFPEEDEKRSFSERQYSLLRSKEDLETML